MYKVYIVDDELPIIGNIVNTILWPEHGFEVVGSNTNPLIALDEIMTLSPDLVFCDLRMPDMDGIELIGALKEKGAVCEFIMLTAFDEFEATRSFFRLEGFDYLLKPLNPQEVEITLERLARKIARKKGITPRIEFFPTQTGSFDDLVSFLKEHFNKKHTLNSLSKKFNISSSYICNLFAKHYNSTLTIFITSLRMEEAARIVRESQAPLKEIAIHCGYSDYFYFCRVFKSYYGVSPTKYRTGAFELTDAADHEDVSEQTYTSNRAVSELMQQSTDDEV